MARFKQFVRYAVWPACLIANAVPILITDTFAPEYVPQAAGASTVVLLSHCWLWSTFSLNGRMVRARRSQPACTR
jgi:hypothetical protein